MESDSTLKVPVVVSNATRIVMSWGSGVSVELFSSGHFLSPDEQIKQICSATYLPPNRNSVPYSRASHVRAEDDYWGVFFI